MTLVEILVAGLVLAVGILATAQLTASSESTTLDAELQQIATEQAEKRIEAIRGLDYGEVGFAGASPTEQPEGADVLAGDELKLPGGGTEQLVAPENAEPGEDPGAWGVDPAPTPFTVERGAGKPPVTGTIYTYLSWRNESCSVLSLEELDEAADLLRQLGDPTSPLFELVGSDGLVQRTINGLTQQLLNILPGNDGNRLKAELQQIRPLLETLSGNLEQAEELLDGIEDLAIDLCSLDQLGLEGLGSLLELSAGDLANLLASLVDLRDGLEALQGPLNQLLNQLSSLVCTLLPPLCNSVNSLIGAVLAVLEPADGDPPKTVLEGVNGTLTEISQLDVSALTRSTTHNTKRVTVAVTVDTARDDITPRNPVWLSTVVTDPEASIGGLGPLLP